MELEGNDRGTVKTGNKNGCAEPTDIFFGAALKYVEDIAPDPKKKRPIPRDIDREMLSPLE